MSKERFSKQLNIRNRQANFEYELLEKITAGLVLTGTEIKSIREGKATLTDGYCFIQDGEAFIKGMNISPYEEGSYLNHEPARQRKLLLKKSEIQKLEKKSQEKGLTIVPLRLYISERGFAKVEIAIARGRKIHDKREHIRERESKRELRRIKR
ncbi:MAG: SsrA-binding protein SmpB [Cyclobacteriaceae bacterium]|jgi:SsrA-binding protein